MPNTRSFEMHRSYREAQDRFDHFVLAAILAVCAYLGQNNPYAPFGFNEETVYFLSLVTFVSSAVCGFKRIENIIAAYRLNHQMLDAHDKKKMDTASEAEALMVIVRKKAKFYYKTRNYLIFVGLFLYVVAKYWAVYA